MLIVDVRDVAVGYMYLKVYSHEQMLTFYLRKDFNIYSFLEGGGVKPDWMRQPVQETI